MSGPDSRIQVYLPDEEATLRLGKALAPFLEPGKPLLLYGDLGMGKSSLARGIIRTLSPETTEVPSPTFNLMLSYDVLAGGAAVTCWHIDLYRIEEAAELDELGLHEILESSIALIEWPERLNHYMPADQIACHFAVAPDKAGRMVSVVLSPSLLSLASDIADAIRFFD